MQLPVMSPASFSARHPENQRVGGQQQCNRRLVTYLKSNTPAGEAGKNSFGMQPVAIRGHALRKCIIHGDRPEGPGAVAGDADGAWRNAKAGVESV